MRLKKQKKYYEIKKKYFLYFWWSCNPDSESDNEPFVATKVAGKYSPATRELYELYYTLLAQRIPPSKIQNITRPVLRHLYSTIHWCWLTPATECLHCRVYEKRGTNSSESCSKSNHPIICRVYASEQWWNYTKPKHKGCYHALSMIWFWEFIMSMMAQLMLP